MMVLNRQHQVPNYTERQDSCQNLMSEIPSQHSHTQISSPPAVQFGRRNIGRTNNDFKNEHVIRRLDCFTYCGSGSSH